MYKRPPEDLPGIIQLKYDPLISTCWKSLLILLYKKEWVRQKFWDDTGNYGIGSNLQCFDVFICYSETAQYTISAKAQGRIYEYSFDGLESKDKINHFKRNAQVLLSHA